MLQLFGQLRELVLAAAANAGEFGLSDAPSVDEFDYGSTRWRTSPPDCSSNSA
ncbi:hypothetical protein ACWEN6_29970 [Sphaerisporangium sp. NPDC004334]